MAAPLKLSFVLPTVAELQAGDPVLSRSAVVLSGGITHMQGLHCAGLQPTSTYLQAHAGTPGTSNYDLGWHTGEPDSETHRIAYYVPVGVDLLYVSAHVLAYATGGTVSPEVTVEVLDSAGGPVDEGMTWTRPATMPGNDEPGQFARFILTPFKIESADRFLASDPTTGPTGPRYLSVGSKAGNVVVVKVTTIKARIVSLFLMPKVEAYL